MVRPGIAGTDVAREMILWRSFNDFAKIISMGELFIFNLGEFMKTYSADTFFETGTGFGFGVQFARIFPFRKIFSVDIVASEIERLKAPFLCDRRVQLFAGRSVDIMRQVLPQVPGNIIFWLDAHFPGASSASNLCERK